MRKLKSSGAEKSSWMPQVEVLKDLKNQYEELKKIHESGENAVVQNGQHTAKGNEAEEIASLEEAITKKVSIVLRKRYFVFLFFSS